MAILMLLLFWFLLKTGSYVVKDGLELLILLYLFPKCRLIGVCPSWFGNNLDPGFIGLYLHDFEHLLHCFL